MNYPANLLSVAILSSGLTSLSEYTIFEFLSLSFFDAFFPSSTFGAAGRVAEAISSSRAASSGAAKPPFWNEPGGGWEKGRGWKTGRCGRPGGNWGYGCGGDMDVPGGPVAYMVGAAWNEMCVGGAGA
jgi:hypothetical protein